MHLPVPLLLFQEYDAKFEGAQIWALSVGQMVGVDEVIVGELRLQLVTDGEQYKLPRQLVSNTYFHKVL